MHVKTEVFPKIIDEDIEKKIKDLNDLKGNWIPVEEKKKMDIKYHKSVIRRSDKLSSRFVEVDWSDKRGYTGSERIRFLQELQIRIETY